MDSADLVFWDSCSTCQGAVCFLFWVLLILELGIDNTHHLNLGKRIIRDR